METLYHFLFLLSLVVPVLLFVYFAFRNRKQEIGHTEYSAAAIIQMALQYVIAYNVVFFIQEFFLTWGKNWIGLTAYLYHNNHTWEGSDPRTGLLQGSGALAIFIFGLLMIAVFMSFRNKSMSTWMKSMVLWLGLHGLMQSLPQVTTAFVATGTDTGQAFAYLGVEGVPGFIVALLSVVVIALLADWFFKQFSGLGLFDLTSPKAQTKSVLKIILVPILIGSFLIIPFRIFPGWDRSYTQFFNLIPWLPWFFLSTTRSTFGKDFSHLKSKGFWATLLVTIGLILFFQLVLASGVRFNP